MKYKVKSFGNMIKQKFIVSPIKKIHNVSQKVKFQRDVGAAVKTEEKNKKISSVVKKRNYFKLAFYAFGITFIVIGLVYILIFVKQQDPSIFGSSRRYYEKAKQCILVDDNKGAEKYLEKCLKSDPTNSDALTLLADLYDKDQKYENELELLLTAVQQESNHKNPNLYKKIVQIYVRQNRIEEAFQILNNLDAYTLASLSSYRPGNIQSSYDAGVYDSGLKLTLSIPEGSSVYYTTDGSVPNFNSNLYSENEAITIGKDSVTLRAIAVNSDNMLGNEFKSQYRIFSDNTPYEFEDSKVEQIVRTMLGKPSGEIYHKDLIKITKFTDNLSGISDSKSISSLSDLSALNNLRTIELTSEPEINDFSVLSSINTLETLSLTSCNISDNALSQIFKLKNVSKLYLINNNISSLTGISSMNNLIELNLSQNKIYNISSLSGLNNISVLNLSNNNLSDLTGLGSLSSLTNLNLSGNTSLSMLNGLSSLTKLQNLDISGISVNSLDQLSACTSITELHADGCGISSVDSLASCRKLSLIDVSNTSVGDFTKLSSTSVSKIIANNCAVKNSAAFIGLTSLKELEIKNNSLSDVISLASLSKLTSLNISGNANISDLSMLLDCNSLNFLNCEGIKISGTEIKKFEGKGITLVN